MLLSPKTTNTPNTPSVEHLVNLWAKRYIVDLSSLSKSQKFYGELVKASLPEARALTAAKLLESILDNTSSEVGIQANSLYNYIPDIIDSHLAQRLTQFAQLVYQKLLEVYQQQSGLLVFPTARKMTIGGVDKQVSLSLSAIPDIEKLATQMQQFLLKYQDKYVMAKDWRALGFITTLFNFTNKLLINQLTSAEKVLLCPYFKFVEEQVSIPWQRVCAAAAKHEVGSPALTLVEQMFTEASEISSTVYCQLLLLFPEHRSLRGGLSNPDIAHSCLRDLDMFQAYLCLCVLEESIRPIERELVSLCVMVMPTVGVEWEMTNKWKQLLADEVISRVKPELKPLLLNYTQGMQEAFFKARQRLGHQGNIIEIPSDREENLTFHLNTENRDLIMSRLTHY